MGVIDVPTAFGMFLITAIFTHRVSQIAWLYVREQNKRYLRLRISSLGKFYPAAAGRPEWLKSSLNPKTQAMQSGGGCFDKKLIRFKTQNQARLVPQNPMFGNYFFVNSYPETPARGPVFAMETRIRPSVLRFHGEQVRYVFRWNQSK